MKRIATTHVEQWIEDFLSTMRSAESVRQYSRSLYKFSDWLRERGFTAGDQFHIPAVQNIEEYLNKLVVEEVPLTMRRKTLSAIRSWFNFLGRGGHIKNNPASLIKSHKQPTHLYRPLTEKHVESAFASIDVKNCDWPARARAIFETIYEDALIASEVCAMNVADIDWERPAISVGGKWLPIEEILVDALRIYLAERDAQLARRKIAPTSTPALFISLRGARTAQLRLSPRHIRVILKNIDSRLNPSKLRDACGVHMLEHGADPRIVASLFRTGIDVIERLRKMTSTKPRERLMKNHPRAKLPQTRDTTIN